MDIREAINIRGKEIEDINDITGSGSLTFAGWNSGQRGAMFSQHIPQSVLPVNPEVPYVATGNEHLFGFFATTTKRAEGNITILKKIRKFSWSDYTYVALTYDKKQKRYDVLKRTEVKNMAESFGFKYNNTNIDNLSEGDQCKKGDILRCSPALDEYENFRYGLNALTVFTMTPTIIEDAVEISSRFRKRAKFRNIDEFKININHNDVFLNMFGENGEYKAFPDIGEKSKDSIICAVRRRDKATEQVMMKNKNLKKLFPDDSVYQLIGDYKIVDIDIWSNVSIDEFPNTPNYDQVKKYYAEIVRYNTELYEVLGNIIDTAEANGHTYSDELSRIYDLAKDTLDPACKWTHNDKIFSNFIISFTISKVSTLEKGNKVTGRHG